MKHRQFCIVVHNVKENITSIIEQHNVSKVKEMLMSVEPYPQGGGQHLHLFLQYTNQRSFKSVLNEYEKLSKRLIEPKPADEVRSWGRVQVDVMRGRFDQANAYLLGETKDKPTGQVISIVKKPCWRRKRYTKKIGDKKNIEEFCGRCGSAVCPGCCPGCRVCSEKVKLQEDVKWSNDMFSKILQKKIIIQDGKLISIDIV